MVVRNSKGQVFLGLHFYPGVAEYQEPGSDPYRVFLNEDTLRQMDASFSGRPVYVHHVDGVESNLDDLRGEADGWVTRSFYNAADGKHWCEFIIVSERGLKAVKNGMRLSNCYIPKSFGQGGLWNGVSYAKEIKSGEYEHLAIVPNPRYEESVILTPEQFKKYNEDKTLEFSRVANANDTTKRGTKGMLQFFKKAKVENSVDLAEMCVVLPKSGREITISKLVNEMDALAEKGPEVAAEDMVQVGEEKMSVKDLAEKYMQVCAELAAMKSSEVPSEMANEESEEKKKEEPKDDMKNEDGDDKKSKLVASEKSDKEVEDKKDEDKQKNASDEAKKKAEKLRNAHLRSLDVAKVDLSMDQVSRGKSRYGSTN